MGVEEDPHIQTVLHFLMVMDLVVVMVALVASLITQDLLDHQQTKHSNTEKVMCMAMLVDCTEVQDSQIIQHLPVEVVVPVVKVLMVQMVEPEPMVV
jgi:hypothetical protein